MGPVPRVRDQRRARQLERRALARVPAAQLARRQGVPRRRRQDRACRGRLCAHQGLGASQDSLSWSPSCAALAPERRGAAHLAAFRLLTLTHDAQINMLAGRIDVQFRVRGSKGTSSSPSSPLPPPLSPSLTRSISHHLLPPSHLATSLRLLASRSRRHRVLYLDPPRQGRPLRGPALESDARRRRRARPAGARLDAADPGARVGCAEGEGRGAEQGGVGSGEARTAGEARGGPGRNPCFRRCSAAASLSRAEHDSERASRGVGASREHFVMVVLSGLARSLALAPPRRSSTCSRSPSTRSLAIDEPPQNWGVYQRCLNARVISGVVEAPPDCARGRGGRGRGGISSCAQGSLGGLNQKPAAARRGCAEQGEQDGRAGERGDAP